MTDGRNGFDIPSFEDDADLARRDRREATATFEVIENEMVPSFYGRGDDGLPHDWIDRIKSNWATLGWNVIASRMVRDYVTTLYEPAAVDSDTLTADDASPARELAAWKQRVRDAWPEVRITLSDGCEPDDRGTAGRRTTPWLPPSTPGRSPRTSWRSRSCTVRCCRTVRSTSVT